MTLLRRRTPVEAALLWRRQYLVDGVWTKKEVYDALLKAESSDEADQIIGNKGWTHYRCVDCRKESPVAVLFGDDQTLCPECVEIGSRLMKQDNSQVAVS